MATAPRSTTGHHRAWGLAMALVLAGCSSAGPSPTAPTCDQVCQDGVAVRALREMIKLAYNLTLQGKPVGPKQASSPCPEGGSVSVAGEASSNADQGTTTVDLTYTFDACVYRQIDSDAAQNYLMTVQGVIREQGILAVQPSTTSAVSFESEQVTLTGEVYSPSIPYDAPQCPLDLNQNGNRLAGTICDRAASVDF